MTFDYNTLKDAAKDRLKLGNWKGKSVFAASSLDLENFGSGAYYILYDDENKIVARSAAGWKRYGEVSVSGVVKECTPAVYNAPIYHVSTEMVEAARKASISRMEGTYSLGYDKAERPIGDVILELDIEDTLRKAREMTVDSLLEGFLFGVMEKD